MCTAGLHSTKTLLHHRLFEKCSFKTTGFRNIFQKESVGKSVYSKCPHCVKSVCIRSYSSPHFPAFGLNTERYGVSLPVQSECGKMWARITPNTDTFYAVPVCTLQACNFTEIKSILDVFLRIFKTFAINHFT